MKKLKDYYAHFLIVSENIKTTLKQVKLISLLAMQDISHKITAIQMKLLQMKLLIFFTTRKGLFPYAKEMVLSIQEDSYFLNGRLKRAGTILTYLQLSNCVLAEVIIANCKKSVVDFVFLSMKMVTVSLTRSLSLITL